MCVCLFAHTYSHKHKWFVSTSFQLGQIFQQQTHTYSAKSIHANKCSSVSNPLRDWISLTKQTFCSEAQFRPFQWHYFAVADYLQISKRLFSGLSYLTNDSKQVRRNENNDILFFLKPACLCIWSERFILCIPMLILNLIFYVLVSLTEKRSTLFLMHRQNDTDCSCRRPLLTVI